MKKISQVLNNQLRDKTKSSLKFHVASICLFEVNEVIWCILKKKKNGIWSYLAKLNNPSLLQ